MSDGVIALTGGTGFVGQAVLDVMNAAGVPVRALARNIPVPAANREHVRWLKGDLEDREALGELVAGTDAVLHLAGAVNAPDADSFNRVNVSGTESLMSAAEGADVGHFVFVSSLSARQPGLSAYGRSKRLAEELVQGSPLDWTIVRPPAIYGPRDREILELFRAAKIGVVPMPPAGRASVIHVADLAALLSAIVTAGKHDGAVRRRIFEPDDGRANGWMHRELARGIGAAMGRDVWAPHIPRPLLSLAAWADGLVRGSKAKLTADRVSYMAHPDWVVDRSKAVPRELWQARIATPEGLKATAEWYREAGWL